MHGPAFWRASLAGISGDAISRDRVGGDLADVRDIAAKTVSQICTLALERKCVQTLRYPHYKVATRQKVLRAS